MLFADFGKKCISVGKHVLGNDDTEIVSSFSKFHRRITWSSDPDKSSSVDVHPRQLTNPACGVD